MTHPTTCVLGGNDECPESAIGRQHLKKLCVLLALVVLSACGSNETQPGYPAFAAADRLPLDICWLDDIAEPLLCGVFSVYENRRGNGGRVIPIKIIVVPAQSAITTTSGWIEHPGGPRYSTVATAHYFASGGLLESFRRTRDVVLVDVRGLHESGPLFCEALKNPRILERYYPVERVADCRAELEERASLGQYSTINAIDDYEDIRKWLGYEKWDVGGWSFGSRFMLTYVHRYPESIRSVSLFIPSILNFERPLDYARFGQQAFDGVVAACSADAACSRMFPTVEKDLATVLDELQQNPVPVKLNDPNTGEEISRVISHDVFAEAVWQALLETVSARQLPYVLHHAARDNFEPFLKLVIPTSPQEQEPEGHYFSVVCPEETSRLSRDRVEAASNGTFVGGYIAMDYMEACEAWTLPLNPEHPISPKVFNIPALIVTGELDPATPPEYGSENAKHFNDVIHITVPQMAHGESGMENGECLGTILDEFVAAGTASDLDISCVETMRPPPFRLE